MKKAIGKLVRVFKKPKNIVKEDMRTYGVAFEKIFDLKDHSIKAEKLTKLKKYIQEKKETASKTITDKRQLEEYDALIHKIELALAFTRK